MMTGRSPLLSCFAVSFPSLFPVPLARLSLPAVTAAIAILIPVISPPAQAKTKLTGYETTGRDMDGLRVSVGFLDGSRETVTWGDQPESAAGGAFGTSWSLYQRGDTFKRPWRLSNSSGLRINSLVLDAVPGNTVFDTVEFDYLTTGSKDGFPFTVVDGQRPSSVQYSLPIDISQGDLFGQLSLFWDDGLDGNMIFYADTDNGTASQPVRVAPSALPKPAPVAMLPAPTPSPVSPSTPVPAPAPAPARTPAPAMVEPSILVEPPEIPAPLLPTPVSSPAPPTSSPAVPSVPAEVEAPLSPPPLSEPAEPVQRVPESGFALSFAFLLGMVWVLRRQMLREHLCGSASQHR